MIRRLLERLGLIRRRHVTVLDHVGNLTPIKGVSLHTQQLGRARRPEGYRDSHIAAMIRAKAAIAHDPSAAGAITAAMTYGLNWTQLIEAREAVNRLMDAAENVVRLDATPSPLWGDEFVQAMDALRVAAERCRKLRT